MEISVRLFVGYFGQSEGRHGIQISFCLPLHLSLTQISQTSHFNMTSVLSSLWPFDATQDSIQLGVLPLRLVIVHQPMPAASSYCFEATSMP
jgi:hypothetical protein